MMTAFSSETPVNFMKSHGVTEQMVIIIPQIIQYGFYINFVPFGNMT
jgi:hypothetical protein